MALQRKSIELEGHGHRDLPIPAASRVGPFVATGGVRGVDRATGIMPDDAATQAANMFANLKAIVEAGGATADSILKVTIWIGSPDVRAVINAPWIELFPDAESRPARHILSAALPGGMLVQCEALAICDN